MTSLRLIALAAAALLTACSGNKPASQEQLSRACEMIKCVCDKIDRSLFDAIKDRQETDMIWREDGTVECPTGYRLERKESSSIYDRPMYSG